MKYKLCSWECNGYQDSDWYLVLWDSEAQTVRKVEVGTTRCAAGCNVEGHGYELPTPEVAEAARAWLEEAIYQTIRAAELRDVLEPNNAPLGSWLRLLRDYKHKVATIPADTRGYVFWCAAYGQFYRNGYNHPGRNNRRVGLELKDGRRVFVALSACRLDREPMSDGELRERAEGLSWQGQIGAAFSGHTWDSYNWLAPALKALREQPQPVALAA